MFNQSLFIDNILYSEEVRIASTGYIQTELTAQTSLKTKGEKVQKKNKIVLPFAEIIEYQCHSGQLQ